MKPPRRSSRPSRDWRELPLELWAGLFLERDHYHSPSFGGPLLLFLELVWRTPPHSLTVRWPDDAGSGTVDLRPRQWISDFTTIPLGNLKRWIYCLEQENRIRVERERTGIRLHLRKRIHHRMGSPVVTENPEQFDMARNRDGAVSVPSRPRFGSETAPPLKALYKQELKNASSYSPPTTPPKAASSTKKRAAHDPLNAALKDELIAFPTMSAGVKKAAMQVLHRHAKGKGRGLGIEGLRAGLQAALRAALRYDRGELVVEKSLHTILTIILDGEAMRFNAEQGAAVHARVVGESIRPVDFEARLVQYLEEGMEFDEATEQATRDVARWRAIRATVDSLVGSKSAS